jgi:hypothetical protein
LSTKQQDKKEFVQHFSNIPIFSAKLFVKVSFVNCLFSLLDPASGVERRLEAPPLSLSVWYGSNKRGDLATQNLQYSNGRLQAPVLYNFSSITILIREK